MPSPPRLAPVPHRLLGPFQQQVLTILLRLGPDVTPMQIHFQIGWRTGRWVPPQQVYTALDRLVARGYATSWSRRPQSAYRPWWLRPGPRLPRAARRFAAATTLGRRALRLSVQPGDSLRAGLPGLGHEDRLYRHWAGRVGWVGPRFERIEVGPS